MSFTLGLECFIYISAANKATLKVAVYDKNQQQSPCPVALVSPPSPLSMSYQSTCGPVERALWNICIYKYSICSWNLYPVFLVNLEKRRRKKDNKSISLPDLEKLISFFTSYGIASVVFGAFEENSRGKCF